MSKKYINICITTNANYLKYAATLIESLLSHINEKYFYKLYILTDKDISDDDINKLNHHIGNKLEIVPLVIDEGVFKSYPDINVRGYGTFKGNYSYFYRWLIPELVDSEKIIYLDTDIVINGDISELYNIELGDNIIGAAKDIYYYKCDLYDKNNVTIGFNSGVLLIDLKKWRENKITEKCFKFKSSHIKQTVFFDQDTLNVVLKDKRLNISPKRNSIGFERISYKDTQYTIMELKEAENNPRIIHYAGNIRRPRQGLICMHPYWYLYFKYVFRTKYWGKKDILWFIYRCLISNIVCRYILKYLISTFC